MIDKQHVGINDEDIEEHLYKFYDKILIEQIKDSNIKKSKTFKILKVKLSQGQKKLKVIKEKEIKKNNDEDEDGWVTDEEEEINTKEKLEKIINEEDDSDDVQPITMANGELLLHDGTILGNKIYSIYYKQRVKTNKFHEIAQKRRLLILRKNHILQKRTKQIQMSSKISFKKVLKTNELKNANSFKKLDARSHVN